MLELFIAYKWILLIAPEGGMLTIDTQHEWSINNNKWQLFFPVITTIRPITHYQN